LRRDGEARLWGLYGDINSRFRHPSQLLKTGLAGRLYGRIEELLLPQIGDAATTGMLDDDVRQRSRSLLASQVIMLMPAPIILWMAT
jgi:hypothetical protein